MYSVFKCNKFNRVNVWHPLKTSTAITKFACDDFKKPPQPKIFLAGSTSKNLHSQKFFWLWKSDNLILAVENVRTPSRRLLCCRRWPRLEGLGYNSRMKSFSM